ncbi:MAG: hypothetical protein ACLUHC_04470 [Clostridia bacterium]
MKKNKNIFGFGTKAAKKARAEINRINEKRSEEGKEILSKEEEKRVIRKVTKEEKRKTKTKAILIALGLMTATTGIEGVALLNSGEKGVSSTKNEITVDMDETEKDINVINSGNRKVFIEGLQVDTNKEENKELKENVTKEVDSLESPEEILNYLKKFYANEYNKENQTQFTDENVRLRKTREIGSFFKDEANDGTEIIRTKASDDKIKKDVDIEEGVISAAIVDNGKVISIQEVLNDNNEYKRLYNRIEEVETYKDNLLVKTGKIIDKGIDWNVAMEQAETEESVKETYKQRFINAIVEYKENQIEKISNSSLLDNNIEEER